MTILNENTLIRDTKLRNGLNVTENRLYKAMIKIGLCPKPQFKIKKDSSEKYQTVDFAFPDIKLVIEVNGPYHDTPEQKDIDRKRYFIRKNMGWETQNFKAVSAYKKPYNCAHVIKKLCKKLN